MESKHRSLHVTRPPGIPVTFQVERSEVQMSPGRKLLAVSSHSGFC